MLFTSPYVLFGFLPIVVTLAWLLRQANRHEPLLWWVLVASIAFYAMWPDAHLPLLSCSIVANFFIVRAISAAQSQRVGGHWLWAGVAANLLALAYYKYAGFLSSIAGFGGIELSLTDRTLPVGISFFTFTQIGFLVDAYRRRAAPPTFAEYGLFVAYFPHLVAGPVLDNKQVMPQLRAARFGRPTRADWNVGLFLLAVGLFKKVVLADGIAPLSDATFEAASAGVALTAWEAWAGVIAYAVQLYFDFSGYSDMALGISRFFGITLPPNFMSPYRARSLVEFWRRWHISLSTFLRDYLYIGLGGNRHGTARRYVNVFLTMALGGLWHGAGWGFLCWGAWHGVCLIVNHAFRTLRERSSRRSRAFPVFSWGVTMFVVLTGWVLFRAPTLEVARNMLAAMLGGNGISLPASTLTMIPQGIVSAATPFARFDGMFHHTVVVDPLEWMAALSLLVAVALFPHNSNHLAAALESSPDGRPDVATPVFAPRVQRGLLAALAGALAAWALMTHGNDSPFLYYQF